MPRHVAVGAVLALLGLLLAPFTAATLLDAHRRSLYFESHGRDDLREWPAAIAKGARYLKIDFNFQTDPYTCAWQQRLAAQSSVIAAGGTPPEAFPLGCFVLCHYYANFTRDFNTTTDLLALLPAMQQSLENLPDYADGLVVQMCFKNKPLLICDAPNSTQAGAWIYLMDQFYAAATKMLQENPKLNVRFVFDSLALIESCNFDRWPLWSSTYTGSWPSTRFNNSGANAKFQMVNMQYSDTNGWDPLGSEDFDKFLNGSSYAFVAWEPSDQTVIASFQETYINFGLSQPHVPGMIMAYNGDPALFHVFTANTTGQSSNVVVGSKKAQNPTTSYVEAWGVLLSCATLTSTGTASSVIECVALKRGRNARFSAVPISLAAGDGHGGVNGVTFAFAASGVDSVYVDEFTNPNAGAYPLMLTHGASFVTGSVSYSADGGVVLNVTDMPLVRFNSSHIAEAAIATTVVRASARRDGTYTAVIATLGPAGQPSVYVARQDSVSLESTTQDVPTSILVAQAAFPEKGLPTDAALSVDWEDAPTPTAAVAWAGGRSVFAAIVSYNSSPSSSSSSGAAPSIVPDPAGPATKVGVGRAPSVDLTPSGHVVMTYGDSFCYNSELVDDDMVLFYGQKECNLQDSTIFEILPNPVLVYVYGLVTSVSARLASGNVHRNGFATVCDEEVLHGAYDLGSNPSATAVAKSAAHGDDALADGAHWIVAAATSLEVADLICVCGTPAPHGERVVVDAFPTRGFYNTSAVLRAWHQN